MFYRLGQFCARSPLGGDRGVGRRRPSCCGWRRPPWSSVALDGDLDQLPADTTTARAARLNAEAFPDDRAKSQIVLVFARGRRAADGGGPASGAGDWPARSSELPELPLVDEVWTETTPVIGADAQERRRPRHARRRAADQRLHGRRQHARAGRGASGSSTSAAPRRRAGLEIGVTGSAAIGGDMLAAAAESLRNTDRTTIVLVALALAVIYRSPWLVVVPLAAIGVAAVDVARSAGAAGRRDAAIIPACVARRARVHDDADFRRRAAVRRRDGLLPVSDRPVSRAARRGRRAARSGGRRRSTAWAAPSRPAR